MIKKPIDVQIRLNSWVFITITSELTTLYLQHHDNWKARGGLGLAESFVHFIELSALSDGTAEDHVLVFRDGHRIIRCC